MKKEDAIRKIVNLKKLYEGAKKINSQGEAEAAAILINKLLIQYNLSIDEIDCEKNENSVIQEEMSGYTYKSIGGKWEMYLTKFICKYNFCRCYGYGSVYKKLIIIGEPQNIEIVRWFVETLKRHLVELSKDRYKEYIKNYTGISAVSKAKFQRDYLIGAAGGIGDKLREEREKETDCAVNALVLCKDNNVNKYIQETFGKINKRKAKISFNEAMMTGYRDGRNTNLNRPIESTETNNQLTK